MRPDNRPRWHAHTELIPALNEEAALVLEKFPQALKRVWPLSGERRRELPDDIRALSQALTCQRSSLRYNYWNKPGFVSAYLYYFLPWNLVRLCRLLPALPLARPEEKNGAAPLLLDAGSGPLALPLAFWIAMPEWRDLPLRVFATDSARQPLELGKALLAELAELTGGKAWPSRYEAAPLESLAKIAPAKDAEGVDLYPFLACAANVLNELKLADSSLAAEERASRLLAAWQPLWREGAPLLFIEPGTRLGGSAIMALREAARELGLKPLAPCPHSEACPLLKEGRPNFQASWCHFIFSAREAPEWLRELSKKARLFKTSLTLSPLLLANEARQAASPGDALACRVISQAFPAHESMCRYACSACGLGLLRDSRNLVSGSLAFAEMPDKRNIDRKSGAFLLEPFGNEKRDGNPAKKSAPIKKNKNGARNAANAARPERASNKR